MTDEARAIERAEVAAFFAGHPGALPLCEAFEAALRARILDVSRRVQKTQITFLRRRVFACVSLMRAKRKAELPDPWIVVTLGLPYPLVSGRVASACEPYSGRWTNHIVVGSAAEIDGELLSWTEQACAFAEAK